MPEPERRRPARWRPWLRALHRDIGYVAVGLTFVYALSGLAVNHIADWDPNFDNYEARHQVAVPLPEDDRAAAEQVLAALAVTAAPSSDQPVTQWTSSSSSVCGSASRPLKSSSNGLSTSP